MGTACLIQAGYAPLTSAGAVSDGGRSDSGGDRGLGVEAQRAAPGRADFDFGLCGETLAQKGADSFQSYLSGVPSVSYYSEWRTGQYRDYIGERQLRRARVVRSI